MNRRANDDQLTDERLDARLEAWLDDGPRASDVLLTDTLELLARRRQRHRHWPWTALRVAAYGATAVVAVSAAVAVTILVAPPARTPSLARPSATVAPTPGWDTRFPVISAPFKHSFTYAIDPASGLILTSYPDPYQFKVQRGPNPNFFDEGVIVHTTAGGLRRDVCSAEGGPVNAHPTPQDVIDGIESLEGLDVSAVEPTTVDGRSALAVTVSGNQNRTCEAYYLFAGFEPPFAWSGNEGRTRRIITLALDGDTVVIVITASDARYDAWVPTAEAFIDSIHFDK